MQPHQERVVAERDELSTKMDKLVLFIGSPMFNTLDLAEQDRMSRQFEHMTMYMNVLNERIAAFTLNA